MILDDNSRKVFLIELEKLICKHGLDLIAKTPDWILAHVMHDAVETFSLLSKFRDEAKK